MATITFIAAFLGGLVSFLSPCVLPLIPAFLGYLAGTGAGRGKLFLHSVFYVLGFSAIFALLGVLLNSFLSDVSVAVQLWLSRIAGILIIIFGLHLVGLLRFSWMERQRQIKVTKGSYWHSALFGMAFAVGWTPCVGPILGSVLSLAAANPGQSFGLLLSYSLGLGIPFLLVGLFTDRAQHVIEKWQAKVKWLSIVFGIILIILGMLVFTENLSLLANWGILNAVLLK